MVEPIRSNPTSVPSCHCPQCSLDAERELCELAHNVALSFRADLEKLYSECTLVSGELRYTLLWRLSQIERAQLTLSRCAERSTESGDDLHQLRVQIADLKKHGSELLEESRLLLDAWRQSASSHPTRSIPRTSGRFSRRTFARLTVN
jgi:hypothetical protein